MTEAEYQELRDLYQRLKVDTSTEELIKALASSMYTTEQTTRAVPLVKVIDGIQECYFTEKILKAREYATIVHHGQKYGKTHEYTKHLADTYKIFLEFMVNPVYGHADMATKNKVIERYQDVACAVWLHDAIEDTNTTRDELEEIFGTDVANLVDAVSGVGQNRKERLASIARKLEDQPDAIIIKLCDRIANTRFSSNEHYSGDGATSLFSMYVKEFPAFKEALGGIYAQVDFIKNMWKHLETISKE